MNRRSRKPSRPDARLRRRVRVRTAAALAALATLAVLDHLGFFLAPAGDLRRYDGAAARIVGVEGGSVVLGTPDRLLGTETTRVRLLGARAIEGDAVPVGETARIELARHCTRDARGRLAARLLVGGESLAARLVARGAAEVDRSIPHAREASLLRAASAGRR